MLHHRYITLIILSFLIVFISCKNNTNDTDVITLEEPPFEKEGDLSLFKSDGQKIRTIDIEIADTNYDRQMGLMNRDHLATHQGMLFIQDRQDIQTFHMKNTRISLDLVYINNDKKIVSFSEDAKPMDETILSSQVPAKYILEINGGLAQEWILEVGDYVSW